MKRLKRCGGFTLFEMLIAIAVLTILVSLVFEILTTYLSATLTLQSDMDRLDKTLALRRFLISKLGVVSSGAHLLSTDPDRAASGLLIGNSGEYQVFGIQKQSNHLFQIELAEHEGGPNLDTEMVSTYKRDQQKLAWTTILRDIDSLTWRFYDGKDQKWLDSWTYLDRNPSIVEIKFQLDGEFSPTVYDFPIVQLAPPPQGSAANANAPLQSPTPASPANQEPNASH
jgi:prepilin-type N-terminal cleavage/methylation domain-containing protein